MANLLREMSTEGQKSWARLLGKSGAQPNLKPLSKPTEFCEPFRTARALAYQCCDSNARETSSGGVLGSGQSVWLTQHSLHLHSGRVQAFVDALGLLVVDRRGLIRVKATA